MLTDGDLYGIPRVEELLHLAEWRGKKSGTIGDPGCFSLHNTSFVISCQ